jgi:hypothetical protein
MRRCGQTRLVAQILKYFSFPPRSLAHAGKHGNPARRCAAALGSIGEPNQIHDEASGKKLIYHLAPF